MRAVQIVLEESLLRAADRAARKAKVNRSALFREALREHLRRRRIQELEELDQEGYRRHPAGDLEGWERVASWPAD
jgi:metal-responsive CopG/Arc/MetJ family transcriptional regulator